MKNLLALMDGHRGVEDLRLLEDQVALRRHPAVQARSRDTGSELADIKRAVMTTLEDVGTEARRRSTDTKPGEDPRWLSPASNQAVRVLLNAIEFVADPKSGEKTDVWKLDRAGRRHLAWRLVDPGISYDHWIKPRDDAPSPEMLLLQRVESAMDELEPRAGATRDFGATPLPDSTSQVGTSRGESAALEPVAQLLGTWKGELKTDWVDPDTGRSPEPMASYMVFSLDPDARLLARHFVNQGSSCTVIQDVLPTFDGGIRIIGVYEAESTLARKWVDPPHRGAHLLDVKGPPGRADRIEGVYWSDRQTTGQLRYRAWCRHEATSFDEAQNFEYASPSAVR